MFVVQRVQGLGVTLVRLCAKMIHFLSPLLTSFYVFRFFFFCCIYLNQLSRRMTLSQIEYKLVKIF